MNIKNAVLKIFILLFIFIGGNAIKSNAQIIAKDTKVFVIASNNIGQNNQDNNGNISNNNSNNDGDSDSNNNISNNNNSDNNSNNNSSNSNNNNTSNSSKNNDNSAENNKSTQNNQTKENQKSNNANLANLGITPNDFKGFKPNTLAYNVTVSNNIDSVKVYATTQDSKAKIISGTGTKKLEVGENELRVVVEAEDGTTSKTYTINVRREETKSDTKAENTTGNEDKSDLVKLEIDGYTLNPKFSPNVYEYKLTINDNIDSLKIITEGLNKNVDIDVAGNTDLKEGENTITILVHNNETKKNSTYQIMVEKETTSNNEEGPKMNDAVIKGYKIRYILLGALGFVVICCIIIAVRINKAKKKRQIDDLYDYDSEDKERLNLDDEKELFSRVNRENIKEKKEEVHVENKVNINQADEELKHKEMKKRIQEEKQEQTLKNMKQKIEQKQPKIEKEEECEEFFSTSRSKNKGKHF